MSDKKIRITGEEQVFFKHMDSEMLQYFSELKNHKLFYKLKDFFELFVNLRKNTFFDENALKFTEKTLYRDHAYKLGEVNTVWLLIRLIAASDQELSRRKDEYEKRKAEIKEK